MQSVTLGQVTEPVDCEGDTMRVEIPDDDGLCLHLLLILLVAKIYVSYGTAPGLLPLIEAGESAVEDHHLKRHENAATELYGSGILDRRYGDLPGSHIL